MDFVTEMKWVIVIEKMEFCKSNIVILLPSFCDMYFQELLSPLPCCNYLHRRVWRADVAWKWGWVSPKTNLGTIVPNETTWNPVIIFNKFK